MIYKIFIFDGIKIFLTVTILKSLDTPQGGYRGVSPCFFNQDTVYYHWTKFENLITILSIFELTAPTSWH